MTSTKIVFEIAELCVKCENVRKNRYVASFSFFCSWTMSVQTPIFKPLPEGGKIVTQTGVVYYTGTDGTAELLRTGVPANSRIQVVFSEPICIKHWSLRFSGAGTRNWKIIVDGNAFRFHSVGAHLFISDVSGRSFEFLSQLEKPTEVYFKIVRGVATVSSLAASEMLDAKFIVEDSHIMANSHILAAKSEVLKVSLFGSMKEAKNKEIKLDCPYKVASIFIKCLTMDDLELDIDVQTLIAVYSLAHRYMVPLIQDEVTLRVVSLTSPDNFFKILQAAQNVAAQQIISALLQKTLLPEYMKCAEAVSQLFV